MKKRRMARLRQKSVNEILVDTGVYLSHHQFRVQRYSYIFTGSVLANWNWRSLKLMNGTTLSIQYAIIFGNIGLDNYQARSLLEFQTLSSKFCQTCSSRSFCKTTNIFLKLHPSKLTCFTVSFGVIFAIFKVQQLQITSSEIFLVHYDQRP